MTFYEILEIIVKKRKMILYINLISVMCFILFSKLLVKDSYMSISKITSSNSSNQSSLNFAAGFASQLGINIGNNSPSSYVYPEIILSNVILKKLLSKEVTSLKYGKNQTLITILMGKNQSIKNNKSSLIATKKLLKMISVRESMKTKINTIKVTFDDPSVALGVNKYLIETIQEHQSKLLKNNYSKTKSFIEQRIIETEKELSNAENILKDFQDRNRMIQNSPNLKLKLQRLNRDVSVLTGVFTSLKQEYEKIKIEELKDQEFVLIIDEPELPLGKSNMPLIKRTLIFLIFNFGISIVIILNL